MSEPERRKPRNEGEGQSHYERQEIKFLEQLEIKIKEISLMAEIVSSMISPPPEVSEDIKDFKKQQPLLSSWIEENITKILSYGAKYEKLIVVDFLINCGVNVNVGDENFKLATDYAWLNKNYKILLSLLKADSFFPEGFNEDDLDKGHEAAEEIQNLVYTRTSLHDLIKNGEVHDVENFKFSETSKLYLNTTNESAAFVALKHKKFRTYAYLKSIGAEFGKDEEKLALDKFQLKENVALQEATIHYFPASSDAHIYYLVSKSRSQKRIINLTGKFKNYYEKLDEIPEVSIILKIVQYADYLDVIFDFDEEEISKVYPLVSSECCSRGETVYKIGRIFIAASLKKRKREEILGTIAHELTHMAMQILYENDCNPYDKSDETAFNFFKDFKTGIRRLSGDPSKILLDAIDKYKQSDHDSELIVRVPHILAQFKSGRDWLKEQIPEFLNFYKKTIMPKCQKFLNESAILKPKSIIKSINESVGELVRLKKCNVFFENVQSLCLADDERVVVYKVENTLLGMLKVLQRLYGKGYVNFHSHFLILKFKSFASQLNEISQAFFMEGSEWLIIEISHKPSEDEMYDVCEKISELLEVKPDKKVVFVAHRNVVKFLTRSLEQSDLLNFSNETTDDNLNLDYLDRNSKDQILKKRVTFQGKSVMLRRLIKSPKLYKFVSSGIIESLLEGREVIIGNEILGLSSLDGPYFDIIQEMDFESFLCQVQVSSDIFILRSKQNEEVVAYLNTKLEGKWISTKFFKNVKHHFVKEVNDEKIFLVNDRFKSKDFKNFCKLNPSKKCHLVDVKDINFNSLLLVETYNPKFYIEREIKKVVVKYDTMKDLMINNTSATFLVHCLDLKSTKNFIGMYYDNVKWLNLQEAKSQFQMLKKTGKTVHWFQMEDEFFTWKNSHGSLANLRMFVDKDNAKMEAYNAAIKSKINEEVIEETDFILEIFDRKVVLIADNPGMGKSTTLTKLYEAESIANAHWIIRINLKEQLKAIRETINSVELTVENVIQFFEEIGPNLEEELRELNWNLLHTLLTTEDQLSKRLLVVFDGFDELLDEEDRKNIIMLLQFLKNETPCKIWITSRLQYRWELENSLETFATEFHPFDYELQKLFIENYLKDHLKLITKQELFGQIFCKNKDSKISIFTKQLLLKMGSIFNDRLRTFIGTPLQLNLIMSGCVDYFRKWASEEREVVELEYLGNNVADIYENFIDKKYSIYFKKSGIIEKKRQERDKKDSEKYNNDLSESLLCKREGMKAENIDMDIILLIGLVVSQQEGNFEFVHFTFREYYIAKVFADYVLSEEIPPMFKEKMIFLFKQVLLKQEFIMIRNFFNLRLGEEISQTKLEHFKNLFLGNSDKIVKPYTTKDSILGLTVIEGHENILNFIYSIHYHTTPATSFKITNILNEVVFVPLIQEPWKCDNNFSYWKVMIKILRNNKNFIQKWEYYYYQCLIEIYMYVNSTLLQEKIQELFPKNEARSLFIASNKRYGILELMFKRAKPKELFHGLLDMLAKLFSRNEQKTYWSNVFFKSSQRRNFHIALNVHIAAGEGNLETCKLVWKYIEMLFETSEEQGKFLSLKDEEGHTALEAAVSGNRIEIVKFLTEKGEKIFGKTETFLQFLTVGINVIRKKHDNKRPDRAKNSGWKKYRRIWKFRLSRAEKLDSIKFLLEKRETEMSNCWFPSLTTTKQLYIDLFPWACEFGGSTLLNFLIEKLKVILNPEELNRVVMWKDKDYCSCLDSMAENIKIEFSTEFEKFQEFLSKESQRKLIMMKNNMDETILDVVASAKGDIINLIRKIDGVLDIKEKRQLFTMNVRYEKKTFFYTVVKKYGIETVDFVWRTYKKLFNIEDPKCFMSLTGTNILFAVAQNTDPETAKFIFELLNQYPTVQPALFIVDMKGDTYFHYVAKKNKTNPKVAMALFLEKLKELTLEKQVEMYFKKNKIGNTFLHEAARCNNLDVVELTLEKMGSSLTHDEQREFLMINNNEGKTVLTIPKLESIGRPELQSKIIQLVFEKAKKVLADEQLGYFLFFANDFKELQNFIRLFCHHNEYFTLFLEKRVEILKANKEAHIRFCFEILFALVKAKEAELLSQFVNYLVKRVPEENQREILMMRNSNGQTALHAILMIYPKKHRLPLFEKLVNVLTVEDQRQLFLDKNGSILHYALSREESLSVVKPIFDIAKRALEKDFNEVITMRDINNNNSILHAIPCGNAAIVKFIFEEAKNLLTPNSLKEFLMMTNESNRTVLHLHVFHKNNFPLQPPEESLLYFFLQEAGALLNARQQYLFLMVQDEDGMTALHLAAKNKNFEAVKLLLQAAKSYLSLENLKNFLCVENYKNQTAILMARELKYDTIATLITMFIEEEINSNNDVELFSDNLYLFRHILA